MEEVKKRYKKFKKENHDRKIKQKICKKIVVYLTSSGVNWAFLV
jgi:hypothetical protein